MELICIQACMHPDPSKQPAVRRSWVSRVRHHSMALMSHANGVAKTLEDSLQAAVKWVELEADSVSAESRQT